MATPSADRRPLPGTLGLRSLAWTPTLLRASETTNQAAQFAAAMYPSFDPAEREAVERAILAIDTDEMGSDLEPGLLTVRRLLAVLPRGLLTTDDAKRLAPQALPPTRAARPEDAALGVVPPGSEQPESDPYKSLVQPVRTLLDGTGVTLDLVEVEASLVPVLQRLRDVLPAPAPVTDQHDPLGGTCLGGSRPRL